MRIKESDTIEVLSEIWKKSLGMEVVDVTQSFFSLGGDSMQLTSIYNEVDTTFPNCVQIADFFTYCTISELAQFIDQQLAKKTADSFDITGDSLLDQLD